MRILYVAGHFPKLSETFVRNEVLEQLQQGHDVRVLSLRRPDSTSASAEEHLLERVIAFSPTSIRPRRWPKGTADLRLPEDRVRRRLYAMLAARDACGALGSFSPQMVHAHFANLPTLVAGSISRLLGVPYTFMAHATDYRVNMSDSLLRDRILDADRAFVVSDFARREIAERTGLTNDESSKQLDVVRASVRLNIEVTPQRSRKVPRITTVARLIPMKGIDVALKAIGELAKRGLHVEYRVVGEGPEADSLKRLAHDLGIADRVTFVGALGNVEAQTAIAESDIALLPSRIDSNGKMDGIPVFLMEAAELAIPAVTTTISGIPELVRHNEGGVLVPPDEPSQTADALHGLLEHPEHRTRLGQGLRRRLREEFSPQVQVERLHRHWDTIRAARASSR